MTEIQTYLVGGAVRDELLGIQSKDLDYSVVVSPAMDIGVAWDVMRDHLIEQGFKIFLESPQFLTIRAKFPRGHVNEKIVGDFVLARKDGPYSDGRRPDFVVAGTLEDDLRRRDFTVNALARAEDGMLIDLFGGERDLQDKRLRAVGDAKDRLDEDALRAFRALRFSITKGMYIHYELHDAMRTLHIIDKMREVSVERIREELRRCFAYDSVATMELLVNDYPEMLQVAIDKGLWLKPTLEEV